MRKDEDEMRRRGVVGRCECECECERERDEARERDKATGAGFDIGLAALRVSPVAVRSSGRRRTAMC